MLIIKTSLYRLFSLAFLFILSDLSPAFSDSVSTTGAQFLKIPFGVRGAGMGGTFEAIADDVSTTYWNTAGLAQIQKIELNLLHVSYFLDTNYEFAGVGLPLGPGSTLGLTASFDYIPSFNSTNNPAAIPGSASDLALSLGFGQTFGENFALGIGGKFVASNLVTYQATGEAVDAGLLLYTKEKDWTLGLSVQNLGQLSSFAQFSSQEKLPLVYRAGLAYRFQPGKPTHFLIGVDFEKPIDSDFLLHTGGEVWLGSKDIAVAFRGGYSLNPSSPLNQDLGGLSGASFGAGIRVSEFEFDYALVPFGILGDTQRFSLTYRFENGEETSAAEEKIEKKDVNVQISPEGTDLKAGTLKQATFDLKPQARTDVKNWSLQITDPKGNVLATYKGKGVPPKQITWDGKDANGNVVPGGIYASYKLSTVNVRGQEVVKSDPIFKVNEASYRTGTAPQPNISTGPVNAQAFVAPSIPETVQPLGLSGVIKVPSIDFSDGGSRISNPYYNYLDQVARLIRKYPNSKVYIEGHAYEEGTERAELQLSQDRADAVLRYLVEKGKVAPENLYSRGHGASAPLDITDTEESKRKNRRVDIVILSK